MSTFDQRLRRLEKALPIPDLDDHDRAEFTDAERLQILLAIAKRFGFHDSLRPELLAAIEMLEQDEAEAGRLFKLAYKPFTKREKAILAGLPRTPPYTEAERQILAQVLAPRLFNIAPDEGGDPGPRPEPEAIKWH